MLESNPQISFTNERGQIENPDLAWDMAHAMKPYWEDANSINESGESIGLSETGRTIAATAIRNAGVEQIQTLQDTWKQPESEPISSQSLNESVARQEEEWSPEYIEEFVGNHTAGVCVSTNMFDSRIRSKDGSHRRLSQRGKLDLSMFYTQDLAGSLTGVNENETEQFSEAGISELVTVVPINALPSAQEMPGYGTNSDIASHFSNDSYVIFYKTMTRSGQFDTMDGPDGGRPGRYTSFTMRVKKDEATAFMVQLKKDPGVVREMMDALVTSDYLDYRTGDDSKRDGKTASGKTVAQFWDEGSRPSYNKFQDTNGGINRIALRTNLKDGPEQAEVLEF